MKKLITIITCLISFVFVSCNTTRPTPPGEEADETAAENSTPATNNIPLALDVFIENSGSMKGYVTERAAFKDILYAYLSALGNVYDTINLHYINTTIVPKVQYANNTDIYHFIDRGANDFNAGTTDMAGMFEMMIRDQKANHVAMFVSDCIFSPKNGNDATAYLNAQETRFKNIFRNKLKHHNNYAAIVYRLESPFTGKCYYYDPQRRQDGFEQLNNQNRPYFIWLLGDGKALKETTTKVDLNTVQHGLGYTHNCVFTQQEQPQYAVLSTGKIGGFKIDRNNNTTLTNIKKENDRGGGTLFRFTLGVDLNNSLIDQDYICDLDHYTVSHNSYKLSSVKSIQDPKYSHQLSIDLTNQFIGKGEIKIALRNEMLQWVSQYTDQQSLKPTQALEKTFGLESLLRGIYEANKGNDSTYYTITVTLQ